MFAAAGLAVGGLVEAGPLQLRLRHDKAGELRFFSTVSSCERADEILGKPGYLDEEVPLELLLGYVDDDLLYRGPVPLLPRSAIARRIVQRCVVEGIGRGEWRRGSVFTFAARATSRRAGRRHPRERVLGRRMATCNFAAIAAYRSRTSPAAIGLVWAGFRTRRTRSSPARSETRR